MTILQQPIYKIAYIIFVITFIQIILGALVAGLDAGMIYNEFPLMGQSFIPQEFTLSLNDPVSVQLAHRIMAYIVFFASLYLAYRLYPYNKTLSYLVVICISIQLLLGIFTLIYVVPIKLALAHQLFAVLYLSIILYIIKGVRYDRST
jgi:cytochrome c oxidase assembly protein subunit 15